MERGWRGGDGVRVWMDGGKRERKKRIEVREDGERRKVMHSSLATGA